jgi:Cu(I)/Ag(I) efflux system protein CusF
MHKLLSGAAAVLLSIAALAQPATVDGEVTRVDKAGARVTLKHAGIRSLDMPPMTLAFRVADPKMLDNVNVGDKVRFAAEKAGGGYTVTALVKAN